MFHLLALTPAKYVLAVALGALLDALLGPRRERMASVLAGGGTLEALRLMLGRIVGDAGVSRRFFAAVPLLTLASYLLLLSLYLALSPAGRALTGEGAAAVRAGALSQIALFWLFFGLPATALSLAACRLVLGWLGGLAAGLRLPALLAGDILLTLATSWALYFAALLYVSPIGPQQGLGETAALTTHTFAYAIAFDALSGVYVWAAFVSTGLVLLLALGRAVRRLPAPGPLKALAPRHPMTATALMALPLLLLLDLWAAVS